MDFVQYLIDALSVGSMSALLALGLTLVFGVMGLINFAYGQLIVWAGYVIIALSDIGVAGFIIGFLAVLATTALSLAMGEVAFMPFRTAPPMTLLLTSFGVTLVLQAAAILVFGDRPRAVPLPDFVVHVWSVGDLRISALQVVTVVVAAVIVASLYALLNWTTLGLELLASAENPSVARLMGVRTDRVLQSVFIISGFIAGVVALLWLSRVGAVSPQADLTPTLKAFIAIVLGGLGSVSGAIAGGLALGAFEVMMSSFLPDPALSYQETLVFALVIALLLLRPEGIAGRRFGALH